MNPNFPPDANYNHLNFSIKTNSIQSAYISGLKHILLNGVDFNDERGDKMKAVWDLMITMKEPLSDLKSLSLMHKKKVIPYDLNYLDTYADQLINGPNASDLPFEYTYYERLRKRWSRLSTATFVSLIDDEVVDSEIIDQIGEVIKLLVKSPNTRRAVCTTWIPSVDLRKNEVPCLNWLTFYNINGVLHLTTGFRSHDAFGAWISNWYGLARLLEYVAKKSNLRMGTLTTVSVNAHYNRLFEPDVINVINYK